jgi:hypothetical protein
MLRENKLKKTLQVGGIALGASILEIRGPDVVYTMTAAGVDFVFICTEHSSLQIF